MKTNQLATIGVRIFAAVILATFVLSASRGFARHDAPPEGRTGFRPRCVVVLRDVTCSFGSNLNAADAKIAEIIKALGPGDRFVLMDIGPSFEPKDNVKVDCAMPDLPGGTAEPSRTEIEWQQKQETADEVWQAVDGNKEAILSYLQKRARARCGGTNIFLALEYVSKRLSRPTNADVDVFIFSDLTQENGTLRTSLPPPYSLDFNGASVHVLFVPWRSKSQWEKIESPWRDWFAIRRKAFAFEMFEPAESTSEVLLDASLAPRVLPSAFADH